MEQIVSARDEGAVVMNYVRPISSSLAADGRVNLQLEQAASGKQLHVITSVVVDATETIPKITNKSNGWYACERYIVKVDNPKVGLLVFRDRHNFVIIDSSDQCLLKESLIEVQMIKPLIRDEFYKVDIDSFLFKRNSDLINHGYFIKKIAYKTPKISYLVLDGSTKSSIKWSFSSNVSKSLSPVAAHAYPERAAFSFLRQFCEASNISRRLVPIMERSLPGSGPIKDVLPVVKDEQVIARFGTKGLALNSLAEQEVYARQSEFAQTDDDVARRFSSYSPLTN
jgi:hypothetical protein